MKILKDQFDRFGEILLAFLYRRALTVRSRYLGAIAKKPFSILFDDRGIGIHVFSPSKRITIFVKSIKIRPCPGSCWLDTPQ
jgi:hypothetical protein